MPGNGVCVVGSANIDLVVRSARLPAAGETLLGESFAVVPGGKGANQAVACARAGAATRFVGATGSDEHGALLRSSFVADGVDTTYLVTSALPSGVALVTVDAAGENTIVVVPGANTTVDRGAVLAAVDAGALDAMTVVLAQLEVPLDGVAGAFDAARARGLCTILNASPAQPLPPWLASLTDVVVVNESELRVVGGSDDFETALAVVSDLVPTVLLTMGNAGARLVTPSASFGVLGHAVVPVDAVGAGDACCGAFAAALAQGLDRVEALRRANAAGALSVTRRGARSAPTAGEVDAFLA